MLTFAHKRFPLLVLRPLMFLALLTSCAALPLAAQTSLGSLTGQVRDPSGALIVKASITITSENSGTRGHLTTSSAGIYTVNSLDPGLYTVEVIAPGFDRAVASHVEVFTARSSSQDFTLKNGSIETTVVVSEQQPLLSSNSSMITTTIDHETVQEAPVPERSVLSLVLLSPGVTGDPQYPTGVQSENADTQTAPIAPGSSLTIGGARLGTSSILVDGTDNTLSSQPRTGVTFSKNVLQEITVQQNGLPAQYGRTGGGIINQSTRGGGNDYHGILEWRHEDPSTEAYTYGNAFPRALHQNLFTVQLSGPVRLPHYKGKDKSFFLASYEPLRGTNVLYQRSRVPTPAELSGNFADSLEYLNSGILRSQGYAAALAAPRVAHSYYQFALNSQGFPIGAKLKGSQYTLIPGDNVSAQLAQNTTAKQVLSYFPNPARPSPYSSFIHPDASFDSDGNNIINNRGVTNLDNRFTVRLDQVLSRADELNVRYTRVPISGIRYNLFGPDSPANNVPTDTITSQNFLVSEAHVLSGSKVNAFHAAYTRAYEFKGPPAIALTQDYAAQLGFLPSTLGVGFPTLSGLPGISPGSGGAINTGGGFTWDTNLGFSDTFSFVSGRHSVQIGADIRLLQLNRADTSNLNGGGYAFSASDTNNTNGGNALESFDLGIIRSYTLKTTLETFHYRWHYYAGFVQDDYRVLSNVTLNLGLRYNVETPRTEADNRQGTFVANIPVVNPGPTAIGAFVFNGSNGLSRHLWPINFTGIEPRIGIAIAPNPTMTVRASFSILHSPLTGLGTNIVPDLSAPNQNTSAGAGGQNPAFWTNYITNQVAAVQPPILGNSGALFTFPNGTLDYVSQRNAVPYSEVWGLSLQQTFGRNSVFEMVYSGQRNLHLFSVPISQNIPSLPTLLNAIATHQNLTSNIAGGNAYGLGNETGLQALNPYQQFFNNPINSDYDRLGSQSYHALYLHFIQRTGKGLTLRSAFTWSKSLDNFSSGATDLSNTTNVFGYAQVQNPYDLPAERSYSTNDVPFTFANAYTYRLPFDYDKHRGLRALVHNTLLAGWSTSGILNLRDGYPYAINLGTNGYFFSTLPGGAANSGGNALQGAQLRPNRVPGVPVKRANYRSDPFGISGNGGILNPAAFTVPGSLDNPQFGNVPRTLGDVRNPATFFFDASVVKNIRIHEQHLRIGVQAANVLNHTNFFLAGRTLTSGFVAPATAVTLGPNDCINGDGPRSTSGCFTTNSTFGNMGQTNPTPGRVFQFEAIYAF